MMLVINSLVPVFALILLGGILRKGGFLTEEITTGMNKLAYWVALPVLLFHKLSQSPLGAGNAGLIFQTLFAATILAALLAWLVAQIIRAPLKSTGVIVQAALRGNLAFVGLPIVLFVISTLPKPEQSYIESSVVLAITLTIIVYSLLSVVVLVYFDREEGGEINKKLFWATVIKNPLAIGCITGVAANCSQIEIPLILARICEALSPAAFPVALLGIGSQLAATQVRKHVGWATIASTIKTVFAPTAGYFVGRALGLSGTELQVAVLFCAMPTAVSSYILAEQLHANADLAASSVVICTVLSFFSLSVILFLPF